MTIPRAFIAAAASAFVFLAATIANAEPDLIGRATVIDGDTLEISGERVRFNGIDAPESGQLCQEHDGTPWRCGQQASLALDDWLAASRPTRCAFVEHDRYGRFVGDCYRADGSHVQDWLVRQGWALDWPRYSDGAYASAQDEARLAGRGIWRGEFTPPWDWRQGERLSWAEASTEPPGDCIIKGNINRSGDQIYHLPGQQHYDQVVIHESRGQRWFCTEEEAQEAGWRRSTR